jgi:preprotein translocase subunit SecG
MLLTILLAAHIIIAILLIVIILLQQGKGATAGAAFGSGASSTVFGARGSGSFLARVTSVLAFLFLANSLWLAYLYGQVLEPKSLLDQVETPVVEIPVEGLLPDVPPTPGGRDDLPDIPVE